MRNDVVRATGAGHIGTWCPRCDVRVRVHVRMDGQVAQGECLCGAIVRIVPPTGDWYTGANAEVWREDDVA